MQITPAEVAETLAMVSKQNLDIRTITLGINLRGCVDADVDTLAHQGLRPHDLGRREPRAHRRAARARVRHPHREQAHLGHPHRGDLRRGDRRRPHARGRGHGPRRQGGGRRFRRRLLGARAQGRHPGRPQAHGLHPHGARRHRPRLRLGERGHARGPASTWTPRCKMAGIIKRAAELTADKRVHRRRQTRRVLQRRGGQPLHGRRLPWLRRGRRSRERGRVGPRRGTRGARRPAEGRRHHHRGRGHQGHRLQDHPRRRAHGPRGLARASACSRASWTCRWPPRPPRAIPWPRSWKPSAWASAAAPAPRRRSPC